ncbi:MAG: CHASE3 domain-containing protein [Bryobacteraceae bacterium]
MALAVQAKTKRRLALLFTVPLAFSLMFFIANTQAENTDIEILSAQNLRSSLSNLLALTQDAETAERGFLLTGDDRYLGPYEQASLQIKTQLELCRNLFNDHPELHDSVEQLIRRIQYKFDQVAKVLTLQRTSGFMAALQYIETGTDQDTMDAIRSSIDTMQVQLAHELSNAHERQRSVDRAVFLFFLVSTAVSIVVLISLYYTLLDYIHRQEAAQGELSKLNLELEQRIDVRTRELQDMNEELQQFAYVASHDLQEPLRTITSFTQLLAARYRGKLDEDADEFISYIVSSSRRMTELINGLLALVRVRKTTKAATLIPLDKLLRDAEACLQAAIRESGAVIEAAPLPTLAVDALQITQLFQNLIGNAIKYRGQSTPVIRISARRNSSNWVFAVADNGQGFDSRYAERIFGLFQRLQGRDVEGTGMGLTISRRIVERHGGKIWAESKLGVGSTFYFSLPAALETKAPVAEPVPAATAR